MKEWVIVGGRIQGVTLAAFLLRKKKVSLEGLSIIEPHHEPLSNWKHCTAAISMPYLRSPSVHHIDEGPFSLQKFAGNTEQTGAYFGRYKRPSLKLFNEHCQHVIQDTEMKDSWVQGRVIEAMETEGGWRVALQEGRTLETKNLAIAIGIGEQPLLPEWAISLKEEGCPSIYLFEKGMPVLEHLQVPITVLGGGISAVHLAISLSTQYPGQAALLKRYPFRVHDFDSDPGWLGSKKQYGFRKLESWNEKRRQIIKARNKGSLPFDLLAKIKHLAREDKLHLIDGHVGRAEWSGKDISMFNEKGELIHQTGTVVLATGFQAGLPGKEWLTPFIENHSLPCAKCGYPIVGHSLQWSRGLYVTGALAELEIGPIARNISGARQAAERITSSLL
ncbi:FAD/NAD(P)-binding protein [Bacillus infantis]|uniref:FAD/NAD(P)-binding protein n=1 Tax=Bacillus infantis TaxID=324767 RepID=UPI002155808D|nr:FAD/NAD(P)-binding protein [Bacillus infantis]MCR6611289.1 FAD/NAD(P)-binding protein [Bacillus infantis]